MANGNPYYVHPGGEAGPGLVGLGQSLIAATKMRREHEAQQSAAKRFAAMKAGAVEAIQSGDPMKMAEFSLQNPEMAQAVKVASGFFDDETEGNYEESLFDLYQNPTEQNAQDLVAARQAMLKKKGVPPEQTKETDAFLGKWQQDPGGAVKQIGLELAWRYPEKFKSMQEAMGAGQGGAEKTTANIKDWKYYRGLVETDPEQAAQFAKQVGITGDATPEVKPTVAMQNFEQFQGMPEGPEKTAFADMLGIKVGESPKEQRAQAAASDKIAGEIENADTTINLVDKIIGTPGYIDTLTGIRGATPWSIPGGRGYDASVAFNQLKNSLTLDNLSKMTGVLSDSDIKILQSAGAGIEPGMSKPAFEKRLEEIKNVLTRKTARYRDKLAAYPTVSTQEQYDNLPPGAVYIEGGAKYRKP